MKSTCTVDCGEYHSGNYSDPKLHFSGVFLLTPAIVVVVALLFYVHGKHLRSCRDGQLT